MNKTAIEWCDMTWNPVTGCLHRCEYCYARRIAKRFCTNEFGKNDGLLAPCDGNCKACSDMDGWEFLRYSRRWNHNPGEAYPFGFLPTFHAHRLSEPAKMKKPQRIFVCSMADIFGEWVPDKWIQAVFEACEAAPWHKYLFLTKNPQRYNDLLGARMLPTADNFWYGGTRTGIDSNREHEASMSGHTFLSIEPIHGPLDDATAGALELWDWIIIGAESGNRKGKIIPRREWVSEIVDYCKMAEVPIFMKNSLADIWGEPLIQEWPEGLR